MSVHVANHKRNEEIPNLAESAVQLADICPEPGCETIVIKALIN